MLNPQIENLRELIKTYTILSVKAQNSKNTQDIKDASDTLAQINNLRLQLAVQAEQMQIFYDQFNIAAAATVNNAFTKYYQRNDINYLIRRGIAYLKQNTKISLFKQGSNQKTITRENTSWQQLFSSVQSLALGKQDLLNLPETIRFGENQSLGITLQGQDEAGYLFFHGASFKNIDINNLRAKLAAEFTDTNGQTLYLPQTQLVPLQYVFDSNTINTYARNPASNSDDNDIFSIKNDRSVLLLRVSSTSMNCRLSLSDEGKNQQMCDRVEMAGVASNYTNAFTTFYDLPFPHLLRKGDRLKAIIQNGSIMNGNAIQAADVLNNLVFEGITL